MNLPSTDGSTKLSSSVLIDDHGEEFDQEARGDEQTEISDLAKMLGEKICRKAGLKQLFFSFSVDCVTAQAFLQSVKLMMTAEKRIVDLVNSLEVAAAEN